MDSKCLLDRLCFLEKLSEAELVEKFKFKVVEVKELLRKRPDVEYTSIFHSVCKRSLYLNSSLQTSIYMIDQDPNLMGLIDSLTIVINQQAKKPLMMGRWRIKQHDMRPMLLVVVSKLRFLKDFLSNELRQRTGDVEIWKYLLPKIRYTVYCIALFMLSYDEKWYVASFAILAIYLLCEIELQKQEIKVVCCDGDLKLEGLEGSTYAEICALVIIRSLIEVLDNMSNLVHHPQILNIHTELEHLKCFLEDLPKLDIRSLNLKGLLEQIAELNIKTRLTIHKLNAKETTEGMTIIMDSELPLLIEKAKLIRSEIEKIPPLSQFPLPSHFPLANGLGFIVLVLEKLSNLLSSKLDWVATIKGNIKLIYEELKKSRLLLMDMSNQHTWNDHIDDIQTQIIEVAYKIECIVDSIALNDENHSNIFPELYNVKKVVMLLNEKIARFHDGKKDGLEEKRGEHNIPTSSQFMTTREEVVGFEEEAENIINQLIGGAVELDVISIFGMPGIGKTTLAYKVYHHKKIIDHFDILAWFTVSQNYNRKELLIETYKQVSRSKDFNLSSEDEVAAILRKFLIGKRYLIVLDDIWDTKVWDDFSRLLSLDEEQSSRIVITTRLAEVASYAKYHSDPLPLRSLSHEESRQLLLKKIFHDGNFPEELSSIGETILEKCQGLPLMIVLVGGILSRLGPEASEWDKVAKNLRSLVTRGEDSMKIVELSYKYLPDHLKPCFLYFGAFREDEQVSVSKLIKLWIAEGFVRRSEQRILEDVAKDLLNELISCSLIMVTRRRRCSHEAKACGVHDLVREFCLRKAREENFMVLIGEDNLSPFIFDNYRLSTHLQYNDYNQIRLSWLRGFCVRSFVWTSWGYPSIQPLWIVDRFKLLRILDLSSICVHYQEFKWGLESLFHLRYLALTTADFDKLPSKLVNLETLLVVETKSYRLTLPQTIRRMVHLRHVKISPPLDLHNCGVEVFEGSWDLENLRSIGTVELKHCEDDKDILKRFPNLRKLKCIVDGEKCIQFPKLDFLCQLESLHVTVYNPSLLRKRRLKFYFPPCLKRLELVNWWQFWRNISVIQTLGNLQKLILHAAFEDKIWNVEDCTFTNLKFLQLINLNIEKWIASADSFPILEELVLSTCGYLKQVPSCFGEIYTLRKIEIRGCKKSAVKSVRKLKEEMEELLGLQLDIVSDDVFKEEEDEEEEHEEEHVKNEGEDVDVDGDEDEDEDEDEDGNEGEEKDKDGKEEEETAIGRRRIKAITYVARKLRMTSVSVFLPFRRFRVSRFRAT